MAIKDDFTKATMSLQMEHSEAGVRAAMPMLLRAYTVVVSEFKVYYDACLNNGFSPAEAMELTKLFASQKAATNMADAMTKGMLKGLGLGEKGEE